MTREQADLIVAEIQKRTPGKQFSYKPPRPLPPNHPANNWTRAYNYVCLGILIFISDSTISTTVMLYDQTIGLSTPDCFDQVAAFINEKSLLVGVPAGS